MEPWRSSKASGAWPACPHAAELLHGVAQWSSIPCPPFPHPTAAPSQQSGPRGGVEALVRVVEALARGGVASPVAEALARARLPLPMKREAFLVGVSFPFHVVGNVAELVSWG